MRKALRIVFVLVFCFVGMSSLYSDTDTAAHDVTVTINEVALLDLDDTILVALATVAPGTGGDPVTGSTDTSKWLQYTSLAEGVQTRSINAIMDHDLNILVPGVSIHLEAADPGGAGEGSGVVGGITLNNTGAQNIVTGIASCATGTVPDTDGAQLTYTLIIDNVALLNVTDSDTVTVTFTLTEDL